MASIASEWLQLHDIAVATASEVRADINEKDKIGRVGTNTSKLARSIRVKMDQLTGDYGKLTRTLSDMERRPADYKLGEGELHRRRGLLTQLKRSYDQLQKSVDGDSSSKRPALFNNDDDQRRVQPEETDRSRALGNNQLYEQQQSMLQAQDRHLDDILHGVTRLKDISEDIHSELDLHSTLLVEIDEKTDKTTRNLKTQTKKMESIQEESGGCCGLVIIFFLILVIILLVATNYACFLLPHAKNC